MESDIKEVKVTGDAAAFLEPSKKRTRKSKKTMMDKVEHVDAAPAAPVPAAPAAPPAPAAPKPVAPAVSAPAAPKPAAPAAPAAPAPTQPVVKIVPKIIKVSEKKKVSIPLTRKKRTFKAKKINLTIAEADPKTRKARKTIVNKVAKMSLEELRKELEEKGLLKKGKKEIPETMLRSMMHDAYALSEGK